MMGIEEIKPFFPLVGPLMALALSAVVLPFARQWLTLYRERNQMIRRQLFEYTEVILFGVFQNHVEYDALGNFRTMLFGERLFDIIVGWNKRPSPTLIAPDNLHQDDRMRTVMRMHASALLLQCVRIDPYFQAGQTVGSAEYRYMRFVACLVRPDTCLITWHDCPRLVLIEESALERIHHGGVEPNSPDKDGQTWLVVLEQIAKEYFEGSRDAFEVITSPVGR